MVLFISPSLKGSCVHGCLSTLGKSLGWVAIILQAPSVPVIDITSEPSVISAVPWFLPTCASSPLLYANNLWTIMHFVLDPDHMPALEES